MLFSTQSIVFFASLTGLSAASMIVLENTDKAIISNGLELDGTNPNMFLNSADLVQAPSDNSPVTLTVAPSYIPRPTVKKQNSTEYGDASPDLGMYPPSLFPSTTVDVLSSSLNSHAPHDTESLKYPASTSFQGSQEPGSSKTKADVSGLEATLTATHLVSTVTGSQLASGTPVTLTVLPTSAHTGFDNAAETTAQPSVSSSEEVSSFANTTAVTLTSFTSDSVTATISTNLTTIASASITEPACSDSKKSACSHPTHSITQIPLSDADSVKLKLSTIVGLTLSVLAIIAI